MMKFQDKREAEAVSRGENTPINIYRNTYMLKYVHLL